MVPDYVEYTADDEMPNCVCCVHVCDDFNCSAYCGPEHGWFGYRRVEEMLSDGN